MRKRTIPLLCLLAFCIALLCPLCAQAVTPLDPTAEASLTLKYQKEEQTFSSLAVSIYRVAEAFPDGTFELIAPFSSYQVSIHDITAQEQWKHIALTLSSYIVAGQVAPYREGVTDASGTVSFERLETGLYLVSDAIAENSGGQYLFSQFMVYLPTPQPDGAFDYTVEANPKCVSYVPKTEYRVTKLWKDKGHQSGRPAQITVDIYKDGELRETQILSAGNNWSYTWHVVEDDQGKWMVAERDVPDGYTVTVQKSGECFSIINTHESAGDTPDSPQTGDTFSFTLLIIILCISGILLILLGIYGRRNRGG